MSMRRFNSNYEDVERNPEAELFAFKEAASAGNTDAMMALGEIYSEDYYAYLMSEPDMPAAIAWYKKAADSGVADAMMALGEIAEREESPEAVSWYEKAFTAGDNRAAGAMMKHFYWDKNYEKVYEWIQKGQSQNAEHPYAQYFLGLLYMEGKGAVSQDNEKARICLKKAAEVDILAAMFVLGDIYRDGVGIEASREKALEWYQKVKNKADVFEASIAYWQLKEPEENTWIFEVLRDVLVSKLDVDAKDIQRESRFVADLGMDSLDIVESIMAIEETFGTEIFDEEVGAMSTVQDLVDTLVRKNQHGECTIEDGDEERQHINLCSTPRKTYLKGMWLEIADSLYETTIDS